MKKLAFFLVSIIAMQFTASCKGSIFGGSTIDPVEETEIIDTADNNIDDSLKSVNEVNKDSANADKADKAEKK